MTVPRSVSFRCVLLAALALALTGCAGVRVYSDPAMTHETGIKVFAPKPYLLVTRTGAEAKPIEFSIIYLPDTTAPSYVKQKGGWGSNDLSLTIENGILREFGTRSDGKGPETLSAVGSLLGDLAGAYKTVKDAGVRNESASREDLTAAAETLRNVAKDIAALSNPLMSAQQKQDVDATARKLQEIAKDLDDPFMGDKVPERITQLEALVKEMAALKIIDPATAAAKSHNSVVDKAIAEVNGVIKKIKPAAPEPATFELYEIVQRDGRTMLVKVDIGG